MNPFVFIVGCPRSGTTLLRRMVDAHPEIAMTRETHWIPDTFRLGLPVSSLPAILLENPRFSKLQIEPGEVERLATDGEPTFASFVSALFDRYGAGQGKGLVGDKTPGYVAELGLLHELWPHARFVHLVRDGRDVCLSALGWDRKAEQFRRRFPTWEDEPVITAALWWRWHVLTGRQAATALPEQLYCELRYEDLVSEPEETCRALCGFLDVRYDEAMVSFHEGRTKVQPGLSAKRAWLPPTPGLRDWRTQMPDWDVQRVEAAAGDALDAFGYALSVERPDPSEVAAATKVAARFPRRPLPQGW